MHITIHVYIKTTEWQTLSYELEYAILVILSLSSYANGKRTLNRTFKMFAHEFVSLIHTSGVLFDNET